MRILFRTAGGKAVGKELGLGHIFRSINLAKEFQHSSSHFLLEDYGGAKNILKKNGFNKIKSIKNGIEHVEDFEKTKMQIKKWKIDVVIIDRYKISKLYIKKLSKITKVVVISDLKEINYKSDLVINGFIGFKNQIIKNKFNSKCLLGPNFQILNKQFSKKSNYNSKKWDLLISFGGFDEKKISDMLVDILPNYLEKMKIKIILGPVAKKSLKLLKLQKKFKNISIKKSTTNMKKEMQDTKYGLCTGGLTSYEFVCMKIPIGIICDENHQKLTANNWEKLGYARNLGIINKNTKKEIKLFLQSITEEKFLVMDKRIIIDGKGSTRAVNEILKIK